MTNEKYEVLDTYTFSRFVLAGATTFYAEYKAERTLLWFIKYHEYIYFHTSIRWYKKLGSYLTISQEKIECGSVVNYKPWKSIDDSVTMSDFIRDGVKPLPSVGNECPKTILKVNYKNYEDKHVLYPNKIIYIQGDE
jgi:hypothetical protein